MMWYRLLLIGVIIQAALAADHNLFKNCSRVDFCNRMRNREPVKLYEVDFNDVILDVNIVQVRLKSDLTELEDVYLKLQPIGNGIVRIVINEVNSTRYKLEHVLKEEPVPIKFDTVIGNKDSIIMGIQNNAIELVSDPLTIKFYRGDSVSSGVEILSLDGNTLVLENTESSKAFTFSTTFHGAKSIYGIHEHTDHLDLQNTFSTNTDPYRLRNLDVPGQEVNSVLALYGAVPAVYAHSANQTSGIFLHNAAEQWIEINRSEDEITTSFMVETGSLDLFVLLGPTLETVVQQFTQLTGVAHLPQIWTLGYHQCRWTYESQEDVKNVIANLISNNFSVDAIWLDIDYTDSKKYFTWDNSTFSDPVEMQTNLSNTNKKLVTIIDPHIKAEEGYFVYDGALKNDLFVKNNNGTVFEGVCWPGLSSYMDFLNPAARDYYASMYSYENFTGSTEVLAGIWNDMNEPSVFDDSLEKTMPGDNLHYGGVLHKEIHNIYGLLQTMSTHDGLIKRDHGKKRPFILTRSHFAGSQRYAAIWTGDNLSDWPYVALGYSQCLTANLMGLVFCGADVGGFDGNPNEELLQRWYQAGAWLPFYRAHATQGSERREPYLYTPEVQTVIRNAIDLRYKHIQIWYTLFYEHTRTGAPVIRPLVYHYPKDEAVFAIDDQLMLGRNIMVRPVMEAGATSVNVYFPGGENEYWYEINDNDERNIYQGTGYQKISVDITKSPAYYRAGGIICRKDDVKGSTTDMQGVGVTVYMYLDINGKAESTYYIDDRESFAYTKGVYNYLHLEANKEGLNITQIDENNYDADDILIISNYVLIELPTKLENGKLAPYKKIVSDKTADGVPLESIKIGKERSLYIKF